MKHSVEILAPAGGKASLRAAVNAGADAVYMGGTSFGARAYAENFAEEELCSAIDYAHIHGKKLYLTVNTLVRDSEMPALYGYLLPYYERGLDAVIVQDVGVMEFIRRCFPDLPLHVSTQATVTGAFGADFFKGLGARRIIPARELSIGEIRKIKEASGLEMECFVHGALCYCYSGQCLLSSMIGGRSGNRGQCAQPCRLPYRTEFSGYQDILSLKDLCAIDLIPGLIEAGIDSFKIEGRMKQPDYVYTVVSMYRKYVDLYCEKGKEGFAVSKRDREILQGTYTRRGYTGGYYRQHNGKEMISLKRPDSSQKDSTGNVDKNSSNKNDLYKNNVDKKEKINGKLILSKGEPAKLYIEWGDFSVTAEGETAQQSISRPLDILRIEKQMRKTGNTEFEFDALEILAEKDIFLPMQALNELRREGILKIAQAGAFSFCRTRAGSCDFEVLRSETGEPGDIRKPEISVLVSKDAHLRKALGDARIDTIYMESELALEDVDDKRKKGQRFFLAMPYIFRESTVRTFENLYTWIVSSFDGVLIRNFETYRWLKNKGYSGEIRSDYNLYVWNAWSKKLLKEIGIRRFTAPTELNFKELLELGLTSGCLIAYGRAPVMISAGCILKNTKGCIQKNTKDRLSEYPKGGRRKDGEITLTDRKKNGFIVKNYCRYCYNVMYNCQPLLLLSRREEVKRLHPAELRLDFLTESESEMEQFIDLYVNCFKNDIQVKVPDIRYTNGHFKRGVK